MNLCFNKSVLQVILMQMKHENHNSGMYHDLKFPFGQSFNIPVMTNSCQRKYYGDHDCVPVNLNYNT